MEIWVAEIWILKYFRPHAEICLDAEPKYVSLAQMCVCVTQDQFPIRNSLLSKPKNKSVANAQHRMH